MRIIIACMFSLGLFVVFDSSIDASDIHENTTSKFAQRLRNKVVGVNAISSSLSIPSQTMRNHIVSFKVQDQMLSQSQDENLSIVRTSQCSHFNILNDMRNTRAPQPLPVCPSKDNLPPLFSLE